MIDEKILIERMEALKCGNYDDLDRAYNDAIENCVSEVNQLAEEQNNDFYEWKKINSNRYDCLAHAESHDSRVLDWCVCPYCGKKIKVVK